jgi:acyl-coenzyme A synthetase/AMP-(fatty) acid ligase
MHVVEQIRRYARETPEATAIIGDLVPISYREFDRRIAAMRRTLAPRAPPAGANVVTDIQDIVLGWVVDLALRSLGLTTIAIREPADFASLEGLDIAAVVTLAWGRKLEVPASAARIVLGREDLQTDEVADEPPWAAPPGAHILLTSGTTGRFKMVRVDAVQEQAFAEAIGEGSGDYMASFARGRVVHAFNFGHWTGAGYRAPPIVWSRGATVVIHQGPEKHRSLLPEVTHALLTPAFLAQLMAAPEGAFPRNDGLALYIVGGALSEPLWRRTCARLTPEIYTAVGATEGGAWTATKVEGPEDLRWHRLLPGQVMEVVDENHAPLPAGQLGLVRVKVTSDLDYLNDEEASRAFFRDGFFYPGDLGVLDGQGRVALYGRVTDVINVLGDKRPAGPVEAALEAALEVTAVCVLSEQGEESAETVHVVIETAAPIPAERLRASAETHLRGFHKVSFHFLERLPRNDMGKVERLRLKKQLVASRLQGG